MPTVTPSRTFDRRCLLAAGAGLILSTAALLAQPPSQAGPGVERALGPKTVDPNSLRQLAEQLRALKGMNLDPKLFEEILKLKAQNLSDQEIAERIRNHTAIQDPQQLEALRKWAQQLGIEPGKGGPFGGGAFPLAPDQPSRSQQSVPSPDKRPTSGERNSGRGPPPPQPIPSVTNPERDGGDRPLQPQEPGPGLPAGMPDRFSTAPPPRGYDGVSQETLERRQKQFRAVAGWWENNVGPLDETPALRQLLIEMFNGRSASGEDVGSLGELLDGHAGEGFGKIADRLDGSGFKLPRLGLSGDASDSSFTPPSAPSGSSFGGINGGTGSWLPVVILLVVAALGLVLWWLWPKLMAGGEPGPRPLPGLGPWPVDPRAIADREALVKAFEYLSVLVCGGGVRTWNHVTIASALERAVPQAEALAEPLARLYAVARYTPAGEPLPPAAIAEAREYLCELAGVPAA